MRGLMDVNGEQFAYLEADTVYTLEGEPTGRLAGSFIVDLVGNPIWRRIGDGIYTVNGSEAIGYVTEEKPDDFG
jgi:hypothetical protein